MHFIVCMFIPTFEHRFSYDIRTGFIFRGLFILGFILRLILPSCQRTSNSHLSGLPWLVHSEGALAQREVNFTLLCRSPFLILPEPYTP